MPIPKNDTYVVRDEEITLNYNDESHSVDLTLDNIKNKIEPSNNPQMSLLELGIYTRIKDVEVLSSDEIRVYLKPAASIELRAGSDDNNKLLKRPLGSQFNGNTISKRRNKYSYNATISIEQLELVGLRHKQKCCVKPFVKDSYLHFRLIPSDAPHSMTVRFDSTGVVGVPSGIGSIGDLDGHGIVWEVEDSNESIVGRTTVNLDSMSFKGRTDGHSTTVSQVEQSDVTHDGESWTQEHFISYLRSNQVNQLGWNEGDSIDINFTEINGNIGLKISDDIRKGYGTDSDSKRGSPSVRKLYQNKNGQMNFYLPNDLAHALKFGDDMVYWVVQDGNLYGCLTRQIFDLVHS